MTDSGPGSQSITVFLLDDSEVVRRELRELLGAEPDIRVVGDAGTAASALTQIRALHPDVAILDVRLPDSDGITVCRQIRAQMPDTACLMLTAYYDDQAGQEAVRAGCAGYLLKKIRSAALPSAVRKVAAGQPVLDPDAMIRPLT
jgi:two-component system, NarL family, response regulator DevR